MHRHPTIIILSLIGIVGLITFAVVKLSAPTPGLLGLGLQSYTNCYAVFTVTNLNRSQIDYVLKVERKIAKDWPDYRGTLPLQLDPQTGVLRPGQVSTLTVPVMVYAPSYPWRLSIFCYKPRSSPNTIRDESVLWLLRLHMSRLAQMLVGQQVAQVSGPQMEQ